MGKFVIKDDGFLLNNEKFQLIGGAVHYFRVPRAYWRDRLEKLVMMGCNTVETIVPWHLHEPRPGEYPPGPGIGPVGFAAPFALYLWRV